MPLNFTDILFVSGNPEGARVFPSCSGDTSTLSTFIKGLHDKVQGLADDVVDYNISHESYLFRGHKQSTSNNGSFHALRRSFEKPMPFSDLKMPTALEKTLLDESLCKGGLVILSGMTGTGKSTTLASLLSERLNLFGGMAVTIENPIEIILEGSHGNGFCIQSSASTEEETHVALKGSLRCFPSKQKQGIVMIGEIRDAYTAAHALNAALSGHIVLTTIHGTDIIPALRRIISIAAQNVGEDEARTLLSETLRVAIHQRYENGIHKYTMLANKDTSTSISQHIASGSMEKLSTAIQQQANRALSGETLW